MKTAAQTSHEVISNLPPILSDSDTMLLVERGWIKSVLDLERKWSAFIAERAQSLESIQEIEELPRAKYLRQSSQTLINTPKTYTHEEMGLLGHDKWEVEKHLFV